MEREAGSDVLRVPTLAELGGAERIVEEHLERALAGLDEEERDFVARLFNQLVTPSGTKIAHGVDDLARYAEYRTASGSSRCSGSLEGARILRRVPGRSSRAAAVRDLPRRARAWRCLLAGPPRV